MTRIAILGGGPAGLATAWFLSQADPKLEITIYQLGWRAGGKGASSRSADEASRIEEHGIHLFGNFYGNAMGMLRAAYQELYPDGAARFDREVSGTNLQLVMERFADRWWRYTLRLPAIGDPSWKIADGDNIVPGIVGNKLVEAILESSLRMKRLPAHTERKRRVSWAFGLVDRLVGNTPDRPKGLIEPSLEKLVSDTYTDDASREYGEAARSLRKWRVARFGLRLLSGISARMRTRFVQVDLLLTAILGALDDRLFSTSIDDFDQYDYIEWLERHGAHPATLNSRAVRAIPNICFQYSGGDTAKPTMSAAAFLTFLLRQLAAPGDNLWFFAHGTGESVIMPLYQVLTKRGVRFEFFSKIEDVIPDASGSIARVEIRRQATPKSKYQPLTSLENGAMAWPAHPLWDQLEEGDRIRHLSLEDWYAPLPEDVGGRITLHRGDDFDHVVLGIPPPAQVLSCPTLLAANPRLAEAVGGLEFIPTQAVQLWMKHPSSAVGLPDEPYKRTGERWATANWLDPMSGYVDFSDLIECETHPSPAPMSLHYFCGPLEEAEPPPVPGSPGSEGYPEAARRRVVGHTIDLLGQIGDLAPGATAGDGFDYSQLCPEGDGAPGPGWLGRQYLRANVQPSERYGLSKPGHLEYRRSAWETDSDNLVLAGDWTYTGININSFEGSVMSGALAAYALTGSPDPGDIIGYDFLRPRRGPRAGIPKIRRGEAGSAR
jgi:uncharacterized protein with NAD-binding domain and iron-sulfur cluster